jgi:signal transduction histidine kinase
VRQARDAVVIDHVAEDEVFCKHHTPAMYGFQSYISMPIFLKDGSFYGTLCAIDPRPAKLKNAGVIGMFKLFAALIAFHLEAGHRLASAQADLLDARATSLLREQFIAVLGHDLRNPLASVAAGTRLLQKTRLEDKALSILDMMGKSVSRMSALIDNVMDLARGRLGGGLTMMRTGEPLEPALRHVVDELRSAYPDRRIEAEFNLTRSVEVDRERVAQLLSNLLGNALVYGVETEPVRVKASTGRDFELSVSNKGPAIPSETMQRLFQPFARGDVRPNQQGLGLGLYIASEIARAHGGTIEAASTTDETRFTFRMPLE